MPSFSLKAFNTYFKRLLQFNQSGNVGCDGVTRNIQSGDGTNTSLSLSDDVLKVQPQNDNTTGTLLCQNVTGNTIFAVDTSNSEVKAGVSLANALTQYQYFQAQGLVPVAGSHMVLSLGVSNDASIVEWTLGTGNNPSATLDVSGEVDTQYLVNSYWYLPDAITVDAVHVLMGGDTASTTDNLNFQLYSYALDISSNHGDLSDGTLVAGTVGPTGSFTSDVHEDAIKKQTLANVPTDVAAGRVILATVESTGTDHISINMTVKYHIQ